MKQIRLVVLSLAALALGRPSGFCTANTTAEPPAKKPADNTADIAALKARIDAQDLELQQLRRAASVSLAPVAPDTTTSLLIKGAGVDPEDVTWRIRAGLSPAQAVEVAALEKAEAEKAKGEKKKGGK